MKKLQTRQELKVEKKRNERIVKRITLQLLGKIISEFSPEPLGLEDIEKLDRLQTICQEKNKEFNRIQLKVFQKFQVKVKEEGDLDFDKMKLSSHPELVSELMELGNKKVLINFELDGNLVLNFLSKRKYFETCKLGKIKTGWITFGKKYLVEGEVWDDEKEEVV